MPRGENTALHPGRKVGPGGEGERDPLWWMTPKEQPNSDPHQATISAALPADVAAPGDTEGYTPFAPFAWLLGDYRPRGEDD